MDAATHTAASRPELIDRARIAVMPSVLSVTARFILSEAGRKASLLAGGDGKASQEIKLDVPANRLHLVRVSGNGIPHLKLRPRFELDGAQRVTRIDAAPIYDAPPTLDELLKDATRNHELERTYMGERSLARAARREQDHEWRTEVAQQFLRDPARRALVHPSPSPRRCFVATEGGRLRFDMATDSGPAHDVPVEAYKRFAADLRKRRERTTRERSEQLVVHEQKRQAIALWVADHGTEDQRARQAVGLLPMQEVIDAMADDAFGALDDRTCYQHDGAEQLQSFLRAVPRYARVTVNADDLLVVGKPAVTATRAQWAFMEAIRSHVPDATVALRKYDLAWKRDTTAPKLVTFSVIVVKRIGSVSVRREFVAPAANEVSDVA